MNFIVENWYIIFAFFVFVIIGTVVVWRFFKLPRTEQLLKVRKWLLIACTQAEAALGSGTGKLKLPYVYDMFIFKFPWLAKIIPFELFSDLVDEALADMRKLLSENNAAKTLVENSEVRLFE